MQRLDKVSTLGTSYSAAQVTAILNDQQNQERWQFDRLNMDFTVIEDMGKDIDMDTSPPKIVHDSTQVVKRSMSSLTIRETDASLSEKDFLSSLVRPRYQVMSPDGGFIEWILGTFTIVPFDQDVYPGWTKHTINLTDFSQLLIDDTFTSSYGASAGDNYVLAIQAIVASYKGPFQIQTNIIASPLTLPATMAWEIGTTRLQAINDLLAAINYFPAWFDEMGVLTSSPIPDYNTVQPSFIFDTTSNSSITMIPIQNRPDISKIYNQVLVIVEDARKNTFSTLYVNNQPSNPISTINWHPKTLTIRDSRITDLPTGEARARTEAQAASRAFGTQVASTFPWALSQDRDVYSVIYNTADEGLNDGIYVEMKWEHTCKTGKPTIHTLERILLA